MKRFFTFLLVALFLASCNSGREQVLKVYNWSTYIDESLIPEFEQWYEEQTGEKVEVIYQTFDVLETMLSKIEKGKEDYDVVCPSDYIIEKMLRNDLLLPLDKNFGDTPNYIDACVSPFIKSYFSKIDAGGLDANGYAGGYMWGTTGILYNPKYVTDEEASTWEVLRNPKFADKIFVKDAGRDVCSQIIIHLRHKDVEAGLTTYDDLMFDYSDSTLAAVEAYMEDVKQYVAGWEADFGKEQMIKERAWVNLNWSGDSEWAIEEAAESGLELRFANPKEGFTIFFDGWVIPKYAKNIKAANYWINFLCRPDIASRNAHEIGYTSVICGQEILDSYIDDSFPAHDISYFFGSGYDSVCVNPVIYPDITEISKSTMEHDWGDQTQKLVDLWSRVKGSSANTYTVVVICVLVVALLAFAIRLRLSSRRHSSSKRRKRR